MGIWRTGRWISVVLLALAVAGGLLFLAFDRTFYPEAPVADFPPPNDLAAAQKQDFEYFKHYLELDKAYTPAARKEAEQMLANESAKAGTLTSSQFDLAIARIAALADNGHSSVSRGPLSRRHNRLPCRFYRFSDGYFVLRAQAGCTPLLGAKVLAIDGVPVDEVASHMYLYTGGPRNHYDQSASPLFLESPELLHAAGQAIQADRIRLLVRHADGSEAEQILIADPANPDEPRVFSDAYLSPDPVDGEADGWKSLLTTDADLPLFLRDHGNPFKSTYDSESGVYYVQFKSNQDEKGHPIAPFVADVKREVASRKPHAIVLDLRLDRGGDFTKTASLMKNLPRLADSVQHVYVLTSAWTFSAGNVGVALTKEHGGDKVTVIGEPVGDRVRLWAEGGSMVLPNSKLRIGYATGLHDYRRPCRGEPGCFWVMAFYPTHITTFEPDVRVEYRYADYQALRDPLLERAMELAAADRAGAPN